MAVCLCIQPHTRWQPMAAEETQTVPFGLSVSLLLLLSLSLLLFLVLALSFQLF